MLNHQFLLLVKFFSNFKTFSQKQLACVNLSCAEKSLYKEATSNESHFKADAGFENDFQIAQQRRGEKRQRKKKSLKILQSFLFHLLHVPAFTLGRLCAPTLRNWLKTIREEHGKTFNFYFYGRNNHISHIFT